MDLGLENPLNLPAAIALCGGKEDVAREIIQMLVNELPEHEKNLNAALAQKNWHDMDYISHKLAGSAAYCGMELLKKQARTLNNMIRDQKWDGIEAQTQIALQAIEATLRSAAKLNIKPH